MIASHKKRTWAIKNQYGLSFDGVNETINIDTALTPLATTTVGTWSAWVKPVDATPVAEPQIFISFGLSTASTILYFGLLSTGVMRAFANSAGITKWYLDTNAAITNDNTWVHVALVQNGVSPVLYVNGAAVAQTFGSSVDKTWWFNNITLNNGRIGNRNFNNGGEAAFFNGNIDDIALFNTNLSAAQVLEIYNGGSRIDLRAHSKAANLAGYWRLGDPDATFSTNWSIPDDSVNTNTGTSVNMEAADLVEGYHGIA